jgi:nucleotide-binding universal stress UspA family protein
MLEKALEETDPVTTDVIVMTAKVSPPGDASTVQPELDDYDQHLMTAVVQRAEKAGKEVKPLIVPTNNPLYAIIRAAKDLSAQELVIGASNKYTAEEQLDQIAFYWLNLHDGEPAPLTVRLLGRDRDVHLDLAGGNRIPKISERRARSVADLRAAGVGVDRVLLVHDNTPDSRDLFEALLTMLDRQVALELAELKNPEGNGTLGQDVERAHLLNRQVDVHPLADANVTGELIRIVREGKFDLLVVNATQDGDGAGVKRIDLNFLVRHAPCRVFLSAPSAIPLEPEEDSPSPGSPPKT